jgi:hypothetical protein
LANLYNKFQKLRKPDCPLVNLPEKSKGRWGLGITLAVMKRCEWVRPVLVAQVKFTEWTYDDQLRQPVFLGLRTDKKALGLLFHFPAVRHAPLRLTSILLLRMNTLSLEPFFDRIPKRSRISKNASGYVAELASMRSNRCMQL